MATTLPGAGAIGILGGGQLGRMSSLAARRLGYKIAVLDPDEQCPAASTADTFIQAPYDDLDSVQRLAQSVDIITVEFENIPVAALEMAANTVAVSPSPDILGICQNRAREKNFLKASGFPHAPFEVVSSCDELSAALARIGVPAVLKTASFGYDGRGQVKLTSLEPAALSAAWEAIAAPQAVVEAWVDFTMEFSVICARNIRGEVKAYPIFENHHVNHILDVTLAPASIESDVAEVASSLALDIAEKLHLEGILAVEMFLGRDGQPIVNELAPRPHNSGHLTLDAALTSQFEQHVRAACGLPLGSCRLLSPAAMLNLLGDLWMPNPPAWHRILMHPDAKLHLYGKNTAKPGRKMGHLTVVAPTVAEAREQIEVLRQCLLSNG